MNKENDLQTLSMNALVLILFLDDISFALEMVYGFQPDYFLSLCHKSLVQGLLKGMDSSEIETQGSHSVSYDSLSSTSPSFIPASVMEHMQCWIIFSPTYFRNIIIPVCLLTFPLIFLRKL